MEYQSVCPFVGIGYLRPNSRKRVCLPPWTQKREVQHSLGGEGVVGGGNSNDWKAWHSVYSVD